MKGIEPKSIELKIKDRSLRVGIVGLGYVGLPLAVAFAKAGFGTTGVDVDPRKVRSLTGGKSYVLDVPSADVKALVRSRKLRATSDYAALATVDAVIICVPTPLSKTKEPDVSYIVDATKRIAQRLKKGQLIVLESTTYPGTTEEVMLPLLERSGLKVERDFFLAFSPERVDPGNKSFDTVSIPKVVGGIGPASTRAVTALYASVIRRIVPVSSAKTAEMVKLLENTFRSVNIGLINEVALMCDRLGIDVWEVIEAAKTKPFGFMPFYPGPGLGGHCLPIDPLYLSWKSRLHGFEARLIELASAVNESMPHYVVQKVAQLLNDRRVPLKNASVLVLGVAYKRDVDDLRESPALEVIGGLVKGGARVSFADPHIASLSMAGKTLKAKPLTASLLAAQDCSVVITDHAGFDYDLVAKNAKLVLDTRNAMRRHKGRSHVHFL